MKISQHIKRLTREFIECQQGIAFVEFALSISVLLILFLGSVEVSRYFLIIQKMEKTVTTVADVVTESNPTSSPITTTTMSQLMSAVTDMMNPYSAGASDPGVLVVITDITQAGTNNPVVNWQYCGGGKIPSTLGPSQLSSRTGSNVIGNAAILPSGYTMNAGEEVVIGEIFYSYAPIVTGSGVPGPAILYRSAIYLPRLGALTSFSSHC